MKALSIMALILGSALGNVDILMPGSGQVPIVGWTHNSSPSLMYCQQPHSPVALGGSYPDVFMSLHEGSDSDPVLLAVAGYRYSFNNTAGFDAVSLPGLTIAASREVHADDFLPPVECGAYALPILPRYAVSPADRRMFLVMNTWYTDDRVSNETWMTTVPADPWSPLMVATGDTTSWRQSVFSSAFCLSGQIPQGDLPAFTAVSGSWDGYPGPSCFGINSVYLESDTLHENTLYEVMGYPAITPEVLATGYGQTCQISLWTDTSGVVWCSSFSSSASTPEDLQIEVPHSEMPFAAALTRTRSDTGILSAWYDGSSIMVRHWQDGWNDFARVVEPWAHVSPGNIAVCSDTDGYWVAWKGDQEPLPQYRFISRDDVTGICENNAGVFSEAVLSVSENPVGAGTTFSISLPSDSEYSLYVFDLYGRSMGELASGCGGSVSGPLDLSGLPAGIYNVVLRTANGFSPVRIVKAGY